jgi:amino acid adenylation domain-containing protein
VSSNEVYEFSATPTQQSLWFIHSMDPASTAYHIPLAFRVRGALDAAALERAFAALVARHEILRTVFADRAGVPVQRVHAEGRLDWRSEALAQALSEDELRARAEDHVRTPFNLTEGPLMRVRLDRMGPESALLVLVFHHIVIDHLSLAQLADELEQLYREGVDSLPEQELQFADYTVWLEETLALPGQQQKVAAWQRRLSGFSGVLDLPTDYPRPASQTANGAEFRFALSADESGAVREFARTAGASLYVVMLSAFKLLLARYSGQSEVIVGTPFANRGDQAELERVVGCFINTLPLATALDGLDDFPALLARVKATVLEAFEGQDVPLEAIVEALKPRRDPSYNPLFQVGFVLQEPPVQLRLAGLALEDLQVHSGGAMYDLHLWLWERDGVLEGLIWFNTDLFARDSVARLSGHYRQMLRQLVAAPKVALDTVSLPTPAELDQFAAWNAVSTRAWPAAASVLELIEAQAARTPDAPAVQGASQRYTYTELLARVQQLACYLLARGAEPGALIGVAMDRDADLLVAVLGILKTGAAYVPLDPDYPPERVRYMLEQADVRLLVTQAALLDALPDYPCERVLLDRDRALIAAAPPLPAPALDAALRMYVIFTSGSTGLPKGVQVSHGNVLNFLRSMAETPGFSAAERLLAVTTLSFDIAVLELYLPLVTGGTVVLAARDQVSDGAALKVLLEQERVAVMQATPSTWRLLLGAGWRAGASFRGLCGGEALPRDLADQLVEAGVELWNLYGPTETTVWSTAYQVKALGAPLLIGRPIANTECYVVDPTGQRLPVGIPGELLIGGAGVTPGYLGRADLTAQSFKPNPWGTGRVYRTGDQVRYRPDGQLEYLNRIDNQVKVRGFRIELGEIETVLARHPAVAQVAVTAAEYSPVDKRLVAYVRFAPAAHLTSTQLRAYLRDHLPDYMIPQLLVEVDAMPLTPNGKIDRKALPDPLQGVQRQQQIIAPRTGPERKLAGLWADVLGTGELSVDNNFFEVGGHSLLAMQLVHRIESEFGQRLHIRDLILNTLEQLAAALDCEPPAEPQAPASRGVLGRLKKKLRL